MQYLIGGKPCTAEEKIHDLEDRMRQQWKQIAIRKENNFGLSRRNVRLTKALEYIAHAGLSARHCEDEARRALDSQNV